LQHCDDKKERIERNDERARKSVKGGEEREREREERVDGSDEEEMEAKNHKEEYWLANHGLTR
jgi:hypothetical protein